MLPRWKDDVPGELPEVPRSAASGARPTGTSARCYDLIGRAVHRAIPTCGGSSARRTGWAIRLRKDYQMPAEYHGIPAR